MIYHYFDTIAIFMYLINIGVGAWLGLQRRRFMSGLLLAAISGPIGWIVVLLMPAGGKLCHSCLEPISPYAKVCCHCGRDT